MSGEPARLKGSDLESVPAFAADFVLRQFADGRKVLYGTIDGCNVWVQPESRSKMTLRDAANPGDAAGPLNFGLQVGQLQAHAGALETNDASFGRLFAGATADRAPLPSSAPSGGPEGYTTPALIVGGCLLLAAVVARFKRSP